MHISKCEKCGQNFMNDGMVIQTEKAERPFCKRCLIGALSVLSGKKNKTPEEIQLLAGIREFLKNMRKKKDEKN